MTLSKLKNSHLCTLDQTRLYRAIDNASVLPRVHFAVAVQSFMEWTVIKLNEFVYK